MNVPLDPPVNFAVQAGFGFTLIVVFVTLILFGTVISQSYTFFVNYPNDKAWLKMYIAFMLLVDLVSSIFACSWQFLLLVENWGVPGAFLDSFWILALNPLFCGITGSMVHLFFAWRVYILTSSKVLSGIIAFFGIVAALTAFSVTILFTLLKSPTAMQSLKPLAILWLLASVLGDVAITLSMTWQFQKVKLETRRLNREEARRLNHVLNRILRSTVQNGLLTSLVALTDLLLFLINNGSPTHTVAFLIPKLYTMTVLSSLNARPVTHEGANDTVMEKGTQFSITKPGSMPLNTLAYNARPGQAPDVESYPTKNFASGADMYKSETSTPLRGRTPDAIMARPDPFVTAPAPRRLSRDTDRTLFRSNTPDAARTLAHSDTPDATPTKMRLTADPIRTRPGMQHTRSRSGTRTPEAMPPPTGSIPPPPSYSLVQTRQVPADTTGAPFDQLAARPIRAVERPFAQQASAVEIPVVNPQLQQRGRSSSRPRPQGIAGPVAIPRPGAVAF